MLSLIKAFESRLMDGVLDGKCGCWIMRWTIAEIALDVCVVSQAVGLQ